MTSFHLIDDCVSSAHDALKTLHNRFTWAG